MFRFIETIEKHKDNIALKHLNQENTLEISYSDYLNAMKYCAYNLARTFGDLKGRHIGIFCESNYEYTVLLGALVFLRAVVVPINTFESPENISYIIDNSDVEALIIDGALRDKITSKIKLYDKTSMLFHNKQLELFDFTDEEADNPLFIIYTSGTVGPSKGVVLTVGNQFATKKTIINGDFIGGAEALKGLRVYTNFPFYHVAGICAWIAGMECCCTLYMSANPKNILFDLENQHVDAGFVTPAVLNLWKKAIRRGHLARLGGLRIVVSAGAKIDKETIEAFLGQHILFGQFYGMTETGGNVTCNFDIDTHKESVGVPVDGVQLLIQDGEICITGSQIMAGYYKNEKATKECLIDGIIHTGDLGYIDEDGYVYITGRKKNLIILSSGENVSPEELEKMLYKCDSVMECKVYESIDRIIAGVFAPEEKQEDIRKYVSRLNKELPIYKRIHRIEFRKKEFEKTASGKIKR